MSIYAEIHALSSQHDFHHESIHAIKILLNLPVAT